jgi:sirohydrochlorin ferrochelatase
MTAFVLFAHGSRLEAANETVRQAAERFRESLPGNHAVQAGFLELADPDLPGAVDILIGRGADLIIVIPYFLTMGRHVERDLPKIVGDIARTRGGIAIEVTPPLDGHPALIDILRDRAREAKV